MTVDHVLEMDKKQSISNADVEQAAKKGITLTAGVYCPNDPEHGRLGVHKTGGLLCGICR